ncbi:D-alanyl-D-alanine carboxypeptidase/D-alanyl-D-alanine-endopeptidase [Actinotalea sp. Marseille-Q4924]|uniref:D-alanyl-D-alanine carboxypeptidase/D-alanyl-D-alanine endopeptidase n=1 Tax=Actinotalea sp. Marseille-Q4924 TaxID=2866571 RepID=UPI001CE3E964|nr:D-alanyl-D-alanine carboxypeptidase/D-alanyl-D-alanine-endopeptidase [Actinotalea sp. Marseille-Q4924]
MARGARVGAALVAVLLVGAGGYGAADAYDRVPGLLTLAPPPPSPSPFPTPPAAVPPPAIQVGADAATDAPVPDAAVVQAAVDAAVVHPWMGSSVGALVVDQLTGDVLAGSSAEVPREPASTAKILTAVAALRALGPERTVETVVVQEGPGRIVLVGGGDVMLAAGAGDPTATNGRAGLADLADQTARALGLAGVAEVSLGVDESLFSGPAVSPGWDPADLSQGFVAPVTPLQVNIAKTREEPYPPRHADPSLHAAGVFAGLLAERGIAVTATERRTAPDGATRIAVVESAPVRDVADYLLRTSDNTVSEALGRLVAVEQGLPGSFEGATRAILVEIGRLGVDPAGAVLVDASGLAEGSMLSARQLVEVLRVAALDPALRSAVVDLPIGGWEGTLEDRFTEAPALGLVRAKTGSLTGTTSLAGTVVTDQGRQLVFAVLADATPPGGQLGPRRVIDALVQQVAGCECPLP